MLVSSVSLVAKAKSGKKVAEKKTFRRTNTDAQIDTEVACELCKKEIEEENFIFKFPSSPLEKRSKGQNASSSQGDRVTIATGDALCLSVERFYYTIVLREEKKSDTTCIFRKKVLETKSMPNGHVETVVFALDCDQDFYMTATSNGDLELNYSISKPRADEPDERMFDVFFTNLGHVLIQPKLCPNTYLHHIDEVLSVQQLDLNWRCPEEYFFHFNAVPESPERLRAPKKIVCTHDKDVEESSVESSPAPEPEGNPAQTRIHDIHKNNAEPMEQIADKFMIELPTRKITKSKNTLSTLFLGCFSGRSRQISVS